MVIVINPTITANFSNHAREVTRALVELNFFLDHRLPQTYNQSLDQVNLSHYTILKSSILTHHQLRAALKGQSPLVKVLQVMPEPSCAALAHIAELAKKLPRDIVMMQRKLLVVFDLGGGTFDIAIIRLFEEVGIEVLCVEGINFIYLN